MTKRELDALMSQQYAVRVCKHLGSTDYSDLQKDRAIRKIINSFSAWSMLSRPDMMQMMQWIYYHYMKEDNDDKE